MKRITRYFCLAALCCGAMASLSSCLNTEDDNVTTNPECAIIAFTIDNIKTATTVKNQAGNDSLYYRTIQGSDIKFNIDQVNNIITSVDSLPHWADLTHVVPSYSAYGNVFVLMNNQYYLMTSGKDSIDFSEPVDLMTVASDGLGTKHYKVKINKSTSDIDTLVWDSLTLNNLQLNAAHRLLALDDRLVVLSGDNTATTATLSADGVVWTAPASTSDAIDIQSVIVFKNQLYALRSDNVVVTSADGINWDAEGDGQLVADRLLGADANYAYLVINDTIFSTTDWNRDAMRVNGTADIDMLPTRNLSIVSNATKTNQSLRNVVMVGTTDAVTDKSVVWYKVASAQAANDQQWQYIQVTVDNPYPLPYADVVNVVRYDDRLVAYLADGNGLHDFYSSDDWGITWRKMTRFVSAPEALTAQPSSVTVMGGKLWLIQSGEKPMVWKGTLK